MEHLFDKLCDYNNKDYYPFHMPGHKRIPLTEEKTYSIDITEIEGFDDLHHPDGILKELEGFATGLYKTKQTKILVNGSTGGLLAAISAVCPYGGKILVARNCHKAVCNAITLRGLRVVYLYPEIEPYYGLNGSIRPEAVKEALQQDSEIQAVLLTSPTYDGVVSDIEAISRMVHAYNLPLLIDEAHGAHLPFTNGLFPESALKKGADIVIQSLHKTLPAFTQTALLHVNSERVDLRKIYQYLSIYQSSSPSYILMAGVGSCLKWLAEEAKAAFEAFEKQLLFWRKRYEEILKGQNSIQLVSGKNDGIYDFDVSKLIFFTGQAFCSGETLYQIFLEDYHLQMEMAAPSYVLALSSVFDREEGFWRLGEALKEIQSGGKGRITEEKRQPEETGMKGLWEEKRRPKAVMTLGEAADQPGELVLLQESLGRISGSSLYLYPPGIPFLLPGEEITQEILTYINVMKKRGLKIQGLEAKEQVFCIKNKQKG